MRLSDDVLLSGSRGMGMARDDSDYDFAVREGSLLHIELVMALEAIKLDPPEYGLRSDDIVEIYLYNGNHFIIVENLGRHQAIQEEIARSIPGYCAMSKTLKRHIWQMVARLLK
jgi:hypothetical protein